MKRSQFNVLQIIFMKKEFEKMYENDVRILKIITNEKYNHEREII